MKPTNTVKKPFGLTLAVKIALEAIKESIAPTSIVIGNLFALQKSSEFPKNLDKFFFSVAKKPMIDSEKKILGQFLEDLKKPNFNAQECLETILQDNWVKKIPPKTENQSKPIAKKAVNKKPKAKKEISAPTIIIKKSRGIWQK